MRIVSGRFRGKKLATPRNDAIRPTSDRTRESLFNILAHKLSLSDIRVLDLFAGTGALGLEAMSRGAGFCLFVDESAAARALIRSNIDEMGLQGSTKIFRRDATRLGPVGNLGRFDLVFLDPPYGKGFGEKALGELQRGSWLNQDALVVFEEQKNALPEKVEGFSQVDRREFGDTAIGIFTRQT